MSRRKTIRPIAVARTVEAAMPVKAAEVEVEEPKFAIPDDWNLGALLNVRNQGDYIVTLFPEEFDHRKPERALRFSNTGQCQDFVSRWYARTWHAEAR